MKFTGKLILLALLSIASLKGFAQGNQSAKKILIVVTSHDQLEVQVKKLVFG